MSIYFKTYVIDTSGRSCMVDNYENLIKMIIDNEIIILSLVGEPECVVDKLVIESAPVTNSLPIAINYKHIFELLKTNTSITHIKFDYSHYYHRSKQSILWYKYLCETLIVNESLNTFSISSIYIIPGDLVGINKILKHNNSLKTIVLDCRILCSNTWDKITDMLKINNFIKTVIINTINIEFTTNFIEKNLIKLLCYNKSLNKIELYGMHNKLCYKSIIDTLYYNIHITSLELYYIDLEDREKITEICERNKHNIRLKNLMLEDLEINNYHYHHILRSFVYSQ